MSDSFRPLLREWVDRKNYHLAEMSDRLTQRYRHRVDLRSPYVFPAFRQRNQYSKPVDDCMKPQSIGRMIRNHAVSVGLPSTMKLGPHAMRHTAATHLAMAGANSFQIQQFLGHTDMDASKEYVRLAVDNVQQTVSNVGLVAKLAGLRADEKQPVSEITMRIMQKAAVKSK